MTRHMHVARKLQSSGSAMFPALSQIWESQWPRPLLMQSRTDAIAVLQVLSLMFAVAA